MIVIKLHSSCQSLSLSGSSPAGKPTQQFQTGKNRQKLFKPPLFTCSALLFFSTLALLPAAAASCKCGKSLEATLQYEHPVQNVSLFSVNQRSKSFHIHPPSCTLLVQQFDKICQNFVTEEETSPSLSERLRSDFRTYPCPSQVWNTHYGIPVKKVQTPLIMRHNNKYVYPSIFI